MNLLSRTILRCTLLFITLLATSLLLVACGNTNSKVYNIGVYLNNELNRPKFEGLKEGLKALNLVEGKNVIFHELNVSGLKGEQIENAVKDFGAKNFDLYWTSTDSTAVSLKKHIGTKPLVVAGLANPIEAGLVQSLEKPGGNVTGVSNLATEFTLDRLRLLTKLDWNIRGVYLAYDPKNAAHTNFLPKAREEATRLGFTPIDQPLADADSVKKAITTMKYSEGQAHFYLGTIPPLFIPEVGNSFVKTALEEKIVMIRALRVDITIGNAMISYGSNQTHQGYQSAGYASKILNGVSPAQLPVEQVSKTELLLNQKLADQWGLKFPDAIVKSADDLIK
jgi:putative tryptophan/tyrosine transport system substrate-binding protein